MKLKTRIRLVKNTPSLIKIAHLSGRISSRREKGQDPIYNIMENRKNRKKRRS